jgi:hypothetical protein
VLFEHWDGRRWQVAGPTGIGSLTAISKSSARNIWAVGRTDHGMPLVFRFDGARWTSVPLELPLGRVGTLLDVLALAPDDVWAVGSVFGTPQPDAHGLAAHWDGSGWSIEAIAPVPLLAVDGVRGAVWAVGQAHDTDAPPYAAPTVEVFEGAGWRAVDPGFTDDLSGVKVRHNGDVWVVGGKFGPAKYAVAGHFDGSQWKRMRPGMHDWLNDVDTTAPNDVWAAGYRALVSWNGARWKRTRVPADMTAIDALSPRNVWAVGTGSRTAVIRHYSCLRATDSTATSGSTSAAARPLA